MLQYFTNVGAGNIVVTGPAGSGIQFNTRVVNVVGNVVTLSNPITVAHGAAIALTFGTPLTYTGTAATDVANLQAALEAMPTIGAGNVVVTGDSTDSVFTVTFQNTLSNLPQNLISAGILQSTAGAAVTEQTAGNGGPSYVYTVTFLGGANLTPKIAQPRINVIKPSNSTLVADAQLSEVATGGFGTLVYSGSTLALDGDPNPADQIGTNLVMPAGAIVALNGNGVGGNGISTTPPATTTSSRERSSSSPTPASAPLRTPISPSPVPLRTIRIRSFSTRSRSRCRPTSPRSASAR